MSLKKIVLLHSILILGIALPYKANFSALYTIKDLEILERANDYSEFLSHAKDIPPTKRDSHWKEMVQGVAEKFVVDCEKNSRFEEKWFSYIESLLMWPEIISDVIFLNNRASYGVKYLDYCLTKKIDEKCKDEVSKFWKRTPGQDPYLATGLLTLIGKYKISTDTWPLYSTIARSDGSTFLCRRQDVKDSLIQELITRIDKKAQGVLLPNQDLQIIIYEIMNDDCWAELKKDLVTSLYSKSPLRREISFTLLYGQNSLSQDEIDTFSAFFILSGPTAGPIFNIAWNNVKNLGLNFERRNEVLKKLQLMDPLPGELFNIFDQKKKTILLNHLHKNFPEYLDHYAKTCIDYLSGKNKFPNGNPTIQCKDFFKNVSGTDLISSKLQQEYMSININNSK